MAESSLPEVMSSVTLLIKTETFTNADKNKGYQIENRGSHVGVSGPFKDTEKLYLKYSHKFGKKDQDGAPKEKSGLYEHSSASMKSFTTASVEPVEVNSVIMSYITEKCSAELEKIRQPGVSMNVSKTRVIFQQQDTRHQLARERFVTFYQKIAMELQSRTYPFNATQIRSLLSQFPDLLLSTQREADEVTLIGRFISLERFEDFLKSPPKKSPPRQSNHMSAMVSNQALQDKTTQKEEACPICLEQMVKSQMMTLEKCKHSFCKDCLKRAFEMKPVCPTCGVIYGELKGSQPKGGKMKVTYDDFPLPGYKKYKTIVIHYIIPDGIQEEEHPNPGQPYKGTVRLAYLPDCPEGKKVLRLLSQAFDQRLIFTIGRSSTTGKNNVVTWNDIHHKTSQTGGPTAYGYPDPDYLKRVQEELKVKGIY